ncbi:MAG TPA: hypothetical protein VNZ66_03630 [Aeromicrobium sp.]|nr:hypothetical protein [Aeromicrobium sp.]
MQRRRTPRLLALFALVLVAAFTLTVPSASADEAPTNHWVTTRAVTAHAAHGLTVTLKATQKIGHHVDVQHTPDVAVPPADPWAASVSVDLEPASTAPRLALDGSPRPHDGRAPPIG